MSLNADILCRKESDLEQINNAIFYELVRAMALPQTETIQALIRLAFGKATRKFSELVLAFDQEIARSGPAAGVQWLLPHFVAGYAASGQEIIPQEGPLLIIANHPASYDGLVISAFVNRPDYKIVIGQVPPYYYLPHVSQHALFSFPVKNTFGRMQTVRDAIQHLKNGGALLIFPRGNIEPDPAFMPNPGVEFGKWSRSLELFIQHVPQTHVLTTIVGGVIAPDLMSHPITWFRTARPDRQRLAFMYQIIRQILSGRELFGLNSRVTFGEVLSNVDPQNVLKEIECSARYTLARHMGNSLEHQYRESLPKNELEIKTTPK